VDDCYDLCFHSLIIRVIMVREEKPMSQDTPQSNPGKLLADILAEEKRQTQLLKPISALAKLAIIILIASVILGVIGIAFSIAVGNAMP
jgi:hypothetical protein